MLGSICVSRRATTILCARFFWFAIAKHTSKFIELNPCLPYPTPYAIAHIHGTHACHTHNTAYIFPHLAHVVTAQISQFGYHLRMCASRSVGRLVVNRVRECLWMAFYGDSFIVHRTERIFYCLHRSFAFRTTTYQFNLASNQRKRSIVSKCFDLLFQFLRIHVHCVKYSILRQCWQ